MFLNRKRTQCLELIILLFSVLLFWTSFNYWRHSNYDVAAETERVTVKSNATTHILQNSCKFPTILPFEPSMQKYLKLEKEIPKCDPVHNISGLVVIDAMGHIRINEKKSIKCYVSELSGSLNPEIHLTKKGPARELPVKQKFWINSDNFLIYCLGEEGTDVYRRQFMGLHEESIEKLIVKGKRKFPQPRAYDESKLSISILALDSTSRTQFLRHMPKTTAVMNKMGFITMNGYNKVGDNSNVNLLPILAEQLAEGRAHNWTDETGDIDMKRIIPYNASVDPDKIQYIWKKMKEKGCETLFNDDIMSVARGILHYPETYFKRGFNFKPTDHYYRPYYAHLYHALKHKYPACYDGRVLSFEFADTWYRFIKYAQDRYTFSFNFLTSLTHDNPNNLQIFDEYLAGKLTDLHESNALQSTVLVIMGDHGQRVHRSQFSFAGRVEERTPMLSIYLPSEFRSLHPQAVNNLINNANRLTSNFDFHETLMDLINVHIGEKRSESRGISLFEEIPVVRNCTDARINSVFCLCMVRPSTLNAKNYRKSSLVLSKIERAIRQYVRSYDCLDAATLKCDKKTIKDYSLPKAALLGLRNKHTWEDAMKKKIALNWLFVEIECSIQTAWEPIDSIDILARLRYSVPDQLYTVTTPPLVRYGTRSENYLDRYCL